LLRVIENSHTREEDLSYLKGKTGKKTAAKAKHVSDMLFLGYFRTKI
jgi:hypothetical protein